jgi:hypothetical protein
LALLLPFALPACLEMEQTITIGPDGAGSQQLRLSMSDAVIQEAKRAMAVTSPDGGPGPLLVFDEKAVGKELAAAGLQIGAYKASGEGQRQVELTASFPSVAVLRQSPLLGGRAEWEFAAGPRPGTLRIALYPQGKAAWVSSREQAEKLGKEPDPIAAEFFRKRQQQLAGLDIKIRLVLPGKVLQWTKTVERTGDCEVVATVRAEHLRTPEDLVRKLAPRYEVVIDGSGVTLPLDGK